VTRLLDDALQRMAQPLGPPCSIALLKQRNPKRADEIDELMDAVRDKRLHASIAAAELRSALGVDLSGATVNRHVRSVCKCRF
jgi:hypothetical protein